MKTVIVTDRISMGNYVAEHAARDLSSAISQQGRAFLVVATGASQFEVLDELVKQDGIDWSRVTGFHLDEYVGLAGGHPASFCRYLKERFVDRVDLAAFHYLRGDADPIESIAAVDKHLSSHVVDVMLCGIGENGHLAFNDPPADFETDSTYFVVELDEACRQQQVGEGWFDSLKEVPTQAISMSIQQIMKSKKIYCSVPDERKAAAVKATLESSISNMVPASILRQHPNTVLVVDAAAASQISERTRSQAEMR